MPATAGDMTRIGLNPFRTFCCRIFIFQAVAMTREKEINSAHSKHIPEHFERIHTFRTGHDRHTGSAPAESPRSSHRQLSGNRALIAFISHAARVVEVIRPSGHSYPCPAAGGCLRFASRAHTLMPAPRGWRDRTASVTVGRKDLAVSVAFSGAIRRRRVWPGRIETAGSAGR